MRTVSDPSQVAGGSVDFPLSLEVAVSRVGVATFAWLSRPAGSQGARVLTRVGSPTTSLVRANRSPAGDASGVDVAVGDSGDATFIWTRRLGGQYLVEARTRTGGGALGPLRLLSAEGRAFAENAVAAGARGPSFAWAGDYGHFSIARGLGPAADGDGGANQRTGDGTPPVITSLRLSRKRFRAARSGRAIAPRRRRLGRRVGARVRFDLSEPARVKMAVERARRSKGRLVNGRCVRRSRRNRRARRCTRFRVLRGRIRTTGQAGVNRRRLSGRFRGRRLPRGLYRLVVRATDQAGMASKRKRIRFRIVRR